jgi:hypothetical protein
MFSAFFSYTLSLFPAEDNQLCFLHSHKGKHWRHKTQNAIQVYTVKTLLPQERSEASTGPLGDFFVWIFPQMSEMLLLYAQNNVTTVPRFPSLWRTPFSYGCWWFPCNAGICLLCTEQLVVGSFPLPLHCGGFGSPVHPHTCWYRCQNNRGQLC